MQGLRQSPLVGAAIIAAHCLECYIHSELQDSDSNQSVSEDCISEDEEAEQATMNYRYALRRLEREYPNFKFSGVSTDSTAVATEKSTLPCPCGEEHPAYGRGSCSMQSWDFVGTLNVMCCIECVISGRSKAWGMMSAGLMGVRCGLRCSFRCIPACTIIVSANRALPRAPPSVQHSAA